MSRRGYWGEYHEPSRRIEAKGGIKSQSKRGQFGTNWWAKRWIAVLESFDIGTRLTRGRSYARSGQVLSIDVENGQIKAKVQGSRPTPYVVSIQVTTLTPMEWQRLAEALSSQAIFAAKLLAGEMPNEIEDAFHGVGLSLFPASMKEIQTDCSCPDWSNPCKHIAAVYYLLGEEFDRNPFLIFKMRGITQEELAGQLNVPANAASSEPVLPPEPLSSDLMAFWNGTAHQDNLFGEVRIPPVGAALPKRLGNFPFWRGDEHFLDALEPIYSQASTRGMDVFLGETGDPSGTRVE